MIGFLPALTLLLVAAKLFGFGHYSWFLAFAPLGLAAVVALAMLVVGVLLLAVTK